MSSLLLLMLAHGRMAPSLSTLPQEEREAEEKLKELEQVRFPPAKVPTYSSISLLLLPPLQLPPSPSPSPSLTHSLPRGHARARSTRTQEAAPLEPLLEQLSQMDSEVTWPRREVVPVGDSDQAAGLDNVPVHDTDNARVSCEQKCAQ